MAYYPRLVGGPRSCQRGGSKYPFDFTWTGSSPEGVTSETYRIEVAGDLLINPSDKRPLVVRIAGLVRMRINGDLVLDDWKDGGLREHLVPLPEGDDDFISFTIEYGHTEGDAVFTVGRAIEEKQNRAQK